MCVVQDVYVAHPLRKYALVFSFFFFRPLKVNHFVWLRDLSSFKHFPPLPPFFFSSFTSFPLDLVACYYATPLPPFFFFSNSYYYFLVRVPTGEFRDGVNERKGGERDVAFDSGQLVCKFPLNIRLAAHFADDTIRGSCVIRSSLSLQWAKQSLSGVGCFSQVWLSQRSDDWTSTCWPSCQQVSSLLLL